MIDRKLTKRKENEKRKRKNAKKNNFAQHRDGNTEGNQTYENANAYIYYVQTFNVYIYDMYDL